MTLQTLKYINMTTKGWIQDNIGKYHQQKKKFETESKPQHFGNKSVCYSQKGHNRRDRHSFL